MAEIVNLKTDEIVFESDDPKAVKAESDRLGEEWHKHHKGEGIPYAVRGFDSVELETGKVREYSPDEPPSIDEDRLVINEEKNTVTVYGNADAPEDFDGTIINAP